MENKLKVQGLIKLQVLKEKELLNFYSFSPILKLIGVYSSSKDLPI